MRRMLIAAMLCAGLRGEIVINGNRAIVGRWDAGGAAATRPAKMGTLLPGTCAAGEVFFKTDAEEGRNLYLCAVENRWTQMAGGEGGGGISLAGDNTYTGANTYRGAIDASGATATLPAQVGTALPAACSTGALFFKSDAPAGRNLYFCTAGGNPGTWTQMTGDSGVSLAGNNTYTGANTYQGAVDAAGATSTRPAQVGTALPAACSTGALFFKSDAAAGRNLYFCTAGGNPGTWTQMTGDSALAGIDRSYVEFREEWISGNAERGHLGSYGWVWWMSALAPSISYVTSDANHPGVLRCTTGTADMCYIDSAITYAGLPVTPGWDLQALVRIPDITSAQAEFGFIGGISWSGGNAMVLHYDAAEGPHWKLKTCADMTCGMVDTGVTAVANQWHLLRLRMTAAGTVLGSADGAEVASTLPLPGGGANLYLTHSVTAAGAVTRSIDIDWTAFRQAVTR